MVKLSFGRGLLFGTAVLGVLAGSGASASAEEVLNIYTAREPGLIKPVLDEFTKETGIKVNTIFIANGLEERIRTEGAMPKPKLLRELEPYLALSRQLNTLEARNPL